MKASKRNGATTVGVWAALIALALLVVTGALAGTANAGSASGANAPQKDPVLRFPCKVAKVKALDPILGTAGDESHRHAFIGNTDVGLDSTGETLAAGGATSCAVPFATASWWFPVLSDRDGALRAKTVTNYYRGYGDQSKIGPLPRGLEMIGSEAQTSVEWGCGNAPTLDHPPQRCGAGKDIKERVRFHNCLEPGAPLGWQGGWQVEYTPFGAPCPDGYLTLPNQHIVITYANPDGLRGELMVSAGHGERLPAAEAAHADVIEGNQEPVLSDLLRRCLTEASDNAVPPKGCFTEAR